MSSSQNKIKIFSIVLIVALSVSHNQMNAQDIDRTSDKNIKPFLASSSKEFQLSWSDEFNSKVLDEDKWEYRLDSKHWSTQLAKNISLNNGMCYINLLKEQSGDKNYTGGGIISKKRFGYGYYEAKIKCPSAAGWHTSFWMMDNHHKDSDTSQIELDPLETNSIDLHTYSTDYHQWRSDIGHMKRYQLVKNKSETLDEFHVYGMEWTEEGAYFYFDGKLVNTALFIVEQLTPEEKANGKTPAKRNVSDTMKNDVQIWLTSIATWLGKTEAVEDQKLPAYVQCEYIRFFKK